jgi:hypothetical protein
MIISDSELVVTRCPGAMPFTIDAARATRRTGKAFIVEASAASSARADVESLKAI